MDAPWCRAVSDWHQRCWFSVEGGSRKAFTRCGVRLGDPLADVVFCFAFSCLLVQLRNEMEAAGLKVSLPHLAGGIFAVGVPSAAGAPHEVELLPPTYMDDTLLFLIGDSPDELLTRLGTATVQVAVDGESPRRLLPLEGVGLLRIVTKYKHLAFGGVLTGRSAVNWLIDRPQGSLPLRPWPVVFPTRPRCQLLNVLRWLRLVCILGCCTSLGLGRCCLPASSKKLLLLITVRRASYAGHTARRWMASSRSPTGLCGLGCMPCRWSGRLSSLGSAWLSVLARGRSSCWPWCSRVAVRAGGGHCSGR